ncbi:actin organization and endocytosis protein [Lobaria immixta]|nr:actin organization and endocytosis protein [Lobaria immixta]
MAAFMGVIPEEARSQSYGCSNSATPEKRETGLIRKSGQSGKLLSSSKSHRKDRIRAVSAPAAGPSRHLSGLRLWMALTDSQDNSRTTLNGIPKPALSAYGIAGSWKLKPSMGALYESVFRDFDENKEGTVDKDVLTQVIGESGLPPPELDRIYRLSVIGTGKVSIGDFKVAMQLIHRRLNGYPIPFKGLHELEQLHRQMGNKMAEIKACSETPWRLAALAGCVMRASGAFTGGETELLKKCGLNGRTVQANLPP